MPKRIFRLRISKIGLKQKLFSQSFKSKLNGKTSAKFVWIDGSVKKDWRSLKLKSGYRTDRLFLYYLLRLARRDLLGIRNNEDGNRARDECHAKKRRLPVSYENSSNQCWRKCLDERLEKEKKVKAKETDVGAKVDEENCGRDEGSCSKLKSEIECGSGLASADKTLSDLPSLNKNILEGKNKTEFHSKEREQKGSRARDEKIKYMERKFKTNKQSTVWKNKQLKVKKSKSKTKEDSCTASKLKHSGKCKTKIRTNSEISKSKVSRQHSADDNVYSFEDSEQDDQKHKKPVGDAQEGMSPGKKLNFNTNGKPRIQRMPDDISFAKTTLPESLFLKTVNPDHGLSVFTKVPVKKTMQFGPLIGQRVKEMEIGDNVNLRDIWQVHLVEGTSYLSTQDEETSNWLRYIRPADNKESANLFTLTKNNSLYFDAVKDINEGEELLYWINDSHLLWSKKKLEKKNCGGCNIQFTHTLYYRKHCMIFHDPNISLTTRKYHCKICGLAVLGKEKIIKHAAEMHHGKGAYQCQYCHKFFLRLNYLEMHRTYGCAENPQRSRPLCDLCGRKFCQPQKLKAHIKRMHSDMAVVLRDFQCKNCQKILGSRAALQRHLKEVHNKGVVGAFTCDRCGKIFQNKSNLKIHMLTHSGVKPFKCQEMDCSAAFTTKQCLKFHYKKIHGFSDEVIPKIERSVAYTFDAYSGGAVSDPDQDSSLQLDNSQYSSVEEKNEGVDLTLTVAAGPQNFSNGKRSAFSPLLPEDPNIIIHLDEKYACTKSSKENARRGSGTYHVPKTRIISEDDDVAYSQSEDSKVNKPGEKKLWVVPDKIDLTQPVFKENSTTSLLVEAAIDAAEKDLIEKSSQESCKNPVSCDGDEEMMENHSEVYAFNHYDHNPPPDVMCEPNLKRLQLYEKPVLEGPKINGFQDAEYRGNFLLKDKSNFNDIFKFNTFLRINTSPFSEIQKDCNLVISVRDQDEEEEMENSRGKDLVTSEGFRSQDPTRGEKFNSCRSVEYDLRLPSGVKFDYGDVDFSEYRSLERSRSLDLGLQRLADKGCEGYERMGEAENLCLKEKPYQGDNLEEFAKLGRESSGFENVFTNETTATGQSQTFGTLFRSPHGIVSPRSYHPGAFESESVDLSVRPPFSSSPIYTLDLTPSRVELPARHLDFRSHLGLPPLRFGGSSPAMTTSDSPQISSTGYGIYQPSYGVSAHRPCQSSQFQPYTPLYY